CRAWPEPSPCREAPSSAVRPGRPSGGLLQPRRGGGEALQAGLLDGDELRRERDAALARARQGDRDAVEDAARPCAHDVDFVGEEDPLFDIVVYEHHGLPEIAPQ